MSDYEDVDYTVEGRTAVITINGPERYNAFRRRTVEELIRAFRAAWADRAVQAVILTGAGDKAFCTGGDVKQRAETGDYGPTESGMFEIGYLHKLIGDIPKPVIAAVIAVGGGHVLHVLCDLTIASETARFGQAGPKVGSFEPRRSAAATSTSRTCRWSARWWRRSSPRTPTPRSRRTGCRGSAAARRSSGSG
jgi:1,4-dihydroxy-2-naphthoyl-CoA synthase